MSLLFREFLSCSLNLERKITLIVRLGPCEVSFSGHWVTLKLFTIMSDVCPLKAIGLNFNTREPQSYYSK